MWEDSLGNRWWWQWLTHMHGSGNLLLGSCNYFVDSCSYVINFVLSVEVGSNCIISLYELLELLLKAVVLIIQIRHVSV